MFLAPKLSPAVVFGLLLGACAEPKPSVAAPPHTPPKPLVTQAVFTQHPPVRGLDVRAGRNLALRSSGADDGEAWVLDENGYVGTFVEVPTGGPVRVTVNANGHADQNVPPRMNVVVGALAWPFDVTREASEFTCTMDLAAGTHFIRIEFVNDAPETNRQLEINSVSVEGGKLVAGSRDELALAAADTYIRNHRRGRARVTLAGVAPGTSARILLKRHAFNFGVNVPYPDNRLVPDTAPAPESDAAKYQRMLAGRFNTLVLSNAGEWAYHEEKRDRVTLGQVDRLFRFAEPQKFRARMRALLWDTQMPAWLGAGDPKPGLVTLAARGDGRAKSELDAEIDERIGYYVRERAKHYAELDVINESLHEPRYYEIYGAAGIADIFNKTARAARDAGANTRLYLNEFNLLQWSRDPRTDAPDPYANWYRRHAEAILRAGGAVDGLGIQYYPDGRDAVELGTQTHSAARAFGVLQNLSTTGLRLSLTEFTVDGKTATPERAAVILEETLRLVFGTPQADTFMLWAIWGRASDPPNPASALFDESGALTVVGRRFDALMKAWSTDLEVPVDADGTVTFDGFYGDYGVTAAGSTREFALVPGKSKYAL